MERIGLTGGPGCGKSAVRKIFSGFDGWCCFDADAVCHEIYEEKNSPFTKLLVSRWGKEVIGENDLLDRKVIAEKIFDNEIERQWLNSILHPEILMRIEKASAALQNIRFVMVEASLLFETDWAGKMDRIIAVWSAPEIQMKRLLERGWTEGHARKRIASQISADKKLEMADFGIINNGSLEALYEQCLQLDRNLKK